MKKHSERREQLAKKKKNKKVIRYRRPLNINVGMIIFALIFAYMAFYVYTYVRREKIEFYEVPEGSIVNDQRHTGIAFRTETVKYTEQAGNINFYLREGKKPQWAPGSIRWMRRESFRNFWQKRPTDQWPYPGTTLCP